MNNTINRRLRDWRQSWVLVYQDAGGTPDDAELEAVFKTDADAMAWADTHFVVPLWIEERSELLGDDGRVIGTVFERHEI